MTATHPHFASIIGALALAASAQAAIQTDTFSYAGGALDPDTYSALGSPAKYRPTVLNPDAAASNGATIGVTGQGSSGGLGSSTFGDYGSYYTFFSAPVSLTLQTTNVLVGSSTITLSFVGGGGTVWDATSVKLNFNAAHTNASALTFTPIALGTVDSPIGPANLTNYTWMWNVAAFGPSTGFSLTWTATAQHSTFDDIQLTQSSVPEPSSLLLAALGVGGLCGLRRPRSHSGAFHLQQP